MAVKRRRTTRSGAANVPSYDHVDPRTSLLSKLGPKGWYGDHLATRGACRCTESKPQQGCDVGEALWWLRRKETTSK